MSVYHSLEVLIEAFVYALFFVHIGLLELFQDLIVVRDALRLLAVKSFVERHSAWSLTERLGIIFELFCGLLSQTFLRKAKAREVNGNSLHEAVVVAEPNTTRSKICVRNRVG